MIAVPPPLTNLMNKKATKVTSRTSQRLSSFRTIKTLNAWMDKWVRQLNDTQHKDIHHKELNSETKHRGLNRDGQHKDVQHKQINPETKHRRLNGDTQHNDIQNSAFGI